MTIAYNIHVIVREGGDLDFFFAFIFLNKECFQQNNIGILSSWSTFYIHSVCNWFRFLLATPSLKRRVEHISALISIAMSMLAIISSGASIYYIYDLLKYPELELNVVFQKLPTELLQQQKEGLKVKTLGGIYSFTVKNIGNKDAMTVETSFSLLDRANEKSVEERWLPMVGIGQGAQAGPFFLEKLEPSKSYYGLVTIACTNCREIKRWYFEIDTGKQYIEIKPVSLSTGIWRVKELW